MSIPTVMKAMVRICLSEIKVFVYSIMTGDTTSPVEGEQATDQIVTEGEMPTPLLPTQWWILCATGTEITGGISS